VYGPGYEKSKDFHIAGWRRPDQSFAARIKSKVLISCGLPGSGQRKGGILMRFEVSPRRENFGNQSAPRLVLEARQANGLLLL
jgi:hypothetical protein